MKQIPTQIKQRKRDRLTMPSKIFKACPYCDSRYIWEFDGQVFCSSCDWDSINVFVECNSMEDLFKQDLDALEEQQNGDEEKVFSKTQKTLLKMEDENGSKKNKESA